MFIDNNNIKQIRASVIQHNKPILIQTLNMAYKKTSSWFHNQKWHIESKMEHMIWTFQYKEKYSLKKPIYYNN